MAGYSIFADTIADMTWPEVEEAGRRNTPLLVPVAVIEQHGLHLPLATDTYAAHLLCSLVKRSLAERGLRAVIAPPYYFGVNATTGMFPGSFTVRPETMTVMLIEILDNCARWGFRRQFIINHHGDGQHTGAVLAAVRSLREAGVQTTWVLAGQALGWVPSELEETGSGGAGRGGEAILRVPDSDATAAARAHLSRSRLDIHAGERETSLIMRFYPDTLAPAVDIAGLQAVPERMRDFLEAESSGGWRALSPTGHIGDPAAATVANGELYEMEAADIAAAIAAAEGGG